MQEVEGKSAILNLGNQKKDFGSIEEVNVIEELMNKDINELNFEPLVVKFVRLTL